MVGREHKRGTHAVLCVLGALLVCGGICSDGVLAQRSTAVVRANNLRQRAMKSTAPPRRRAPNLASHLAAPNTVVPVVHRISGWKLLTLLQRYDLQAPIEYASDFVHTNIVAGYEFDNRRYIIARLPQAEIEAVAVEMPPAIVEQLNKAENEPNALVIVDSKRTEQPVRFVGLDARTGLSLLEVKKEVGAVEQASAPKASFSLAELRLLPGAHLRLLAPGAIRSALSVSSSAAASPVLWRINEISVRLTQIVPAANGKPARLIARADKLSLIKSNLKLDGAIAINNAGALVGIVEEVANGEVYIITRDEIDAVRRRVLARQSSVPQPWLGAQGQPLAGIEKQRLIDAGWQPAAAERLLTNQQGVLLTTVPPFTPAALANLRPGDVVTRIGERSVHSNEDFAKSLADAGANADVQLTVERAEQQTAQHVNVRLSESFNPATETERAARGARLAAVGSSVAKLLLPLGLEIVTAPANLRAKLGATEGLLVVSLRKGGVAAASGLRPGDIIERANGKLLIEPDAASLTAENKTEVTFDVIRAGQRISISMKYLLPNEQ